MEKGAAMENKRAIITREDSSEIFQYDFEDYPVYARKGETSHFSNLSAAGHWHVDLEFIAVENGMMTYYVNGNAVPLEKGQGIFVNSSRLHGFHSDRPGCSYFCVLVHPMLLCASRQIEQSFVAPALNGVPYLLLDEKTKWQGQVLKKLKEICLWRDKDGAPLKIQSLCYDLWLTLYQQIFREQKPFQTPEKIGRGLTALKDMVLYIQRNYREKISLEDIAKSGAVCKNTCISLFKKYLRDTPVNYLILYRLGKAVNLLTSSGLSITETAYETGFLNISYFIRSFRKVYGCSPLEYRKSKKMEERK